MYHCCYST